MNTDRDKEFERLLQIGTIGEDIVYDYLVANNGLVQDQRKQSHDDGSGPKLRGTEGTLVLPDFVVYNKNPAKGRYAVDVKVKTSVYPINGKMCFTVDNKFEQYKRAAQVQGLDYLAIIFIYNGRMHFYKETECIGTHYFGNTYSKGAVYLFEYSEDKIVY